MPGSSGMLALGMFNKDRDMKRVKKADGGMMTAQVMPAPMPNPVAVNAPRATFGGGMGPNAPEGRGYNREGFKGRGPMGMRKPEGGRIVGGNPAVGVVDRGMAVGGGPAPIVDRGMAVGGGPAPVVSMGPGTGIGGSMPRSGGAVTARPLGAAPVTSTVGFKKGGMVSKGKHSSVTPPGGRAGGKSKPCKIS